jgi:hypothetical protein
MDELHDLIIAARVFVDSQESKLVDEENDG